MTENPRTRTITWKDPRQLVEPLRRLSGLEFLQKIAAKELPGPPISKLMDFGSRRTSATRRWRSK